MFNGLPVLAIIPARGGSKRLPKKNLQEIIKGKSLLAYAIEKLGKTKYVDEIVVSTDSEDITSHVFGLSKPNGKTVTIFQRDPELAKDETFIMPVVREVLNDKNFSRYKQGFTIVHQIDNPKTVTRDFDMAMDKFNENLHPHMDVVIATDLLGYQSGSIRCLRGDVANKLCLEYVVSFYHLIYSPIDIHYEMDLVQARTEVEFVEALESVLEKANAGKKLEE